MEPDPGQVAALIRAAAGAPPPPGALRLVRLDLPPLRDVAAEAPWLVVDPASGRAVLAPIEVCGAGLRLWHDRARDLGAGPGVVLWAMPAERPASRVPRPGA